MYQAESHDLADVRVWGQDGSVHHGLQVLRDHRAVWELSRVHNGYLLTTVLLKLKQNTAQITPLGDQNPSISLVHFYRREATVQGFVKSGKVREQDFEIINYKQPAKWIP